MNVCSTRLNIKVPRKTTVSIKPKLYINCPISTMPAPKKEKGASISKLKRSKKASKKGIWKKVMIGLAIAAAAGGVAVFLGII